MAYPVLSCLALSCLVVSCLVVSCLVLFLSCLVLVLSYLVLSRLVLSCLVLSCLVWSGLVWCCLVLSCLVLSCLVSHSPEPLLSVFRSFFNRACGSRALVMVLFVVFSMDRSIFSFLVLWLILFPNLCFDFFSTL